MMKLTTAIVFALLGTSSPVSAKIGEVASAGVPDAKIPNDDVIDANIPDGVAGVSLTAADIVGDRKLTTKKYDGIPPTPFSSTRECKKWCAKDERQRCRKCGKYCGIEWDRCMDSHDDRDFCDDRMEFCEEETRFVNYSGKKYYCFDGDMTKSGTDCQDDYHDCVDDCLFGGFFQSF